MPIAIEARLAYFFLLELGPLVLRLNPKTLKLIGVRHVGGE